MSIYPAGKTPVQFAKFLIVGGAGTVLNLVVFWLCTELLKIHFMVASIVAFLCAVTFNY